MFKKRKIHRRVETLFGKEEILSEEEIAVLVDLMIDGDTVARDKVVLSHVRLATSIGLMYGEEDSIGVAMVALMDGIQRVIAGKEITTGIKGYLVCLIHSRCRKQNNHIVRVPGKTYGKKMRAGESIFLHETKADRTSALALRMDLDVLCKNDLERDIISMREQLFTYREIGEKIDRSHQYVKNIVDRIWRELCV